MAPERDDEMSSEATANAIGEPIQRSRQITAPSLSRSAPEDPSEIDDEPEGVVEGKDWPLVPDAEYQAVYVGHDGVEVRQFRGAAKVFVRLRLYDAGEHTDKVLYRAYRVPWVKGRRLSAATLSRSAAL